MAVTRRVVSYIDDFFGARSFSTTPEGATGWTIFDTSAAGAPTYASVTPSASGEVALTMAADNEAQVLNLYHQDKLCFDVDQIEKMIFVAKVAGIDAVTTVVMGLASARNSTADSVATNVWFRMEGSASTSNIVCESDDTVTDYDDKATGVTLSSTYKRFEISFENGKSDIRFFIDGVRVAPTVTFTLATETGSLQPYFQIQKASGTGVGALTLDYVEIVHKVATGA